MNPLLNQPLASDTSFIPFPSIKTEHFAPAFEKEIENTKKAIAAIASAPASFSNTIEGIEFHKENLERISQVFFNLLSANTSDDLQTLAKDISPKLAELGNDLLLNQEIFQKVKAVHEKPGQLSAEQQQLLDKTYKAFRRNGGLLDQQDKQKLREIDKSLAIEGQIFSDNVLKATNDYVLYVTDENDICELPAAVKEEASNTAGEKGRAGTWAFTLHQPSYLPFMQFCPNETLRKELWTAMMSKGMKNPSDNRLSVLKIASLRHQRANLLGYPTHAHFVLEERMAGSPDKVNSFLQDLLRHSRPAAERDLKELQAAKKKHTGKDDLRQWDVPYYSERLRKEKYSLDQEQLRPFFRLESVIQGVFEHAKKLYGIDFSERKDIPVYHPDVKTYEVRRNKTELVGYFYADFFPRASKRGGAWMTNFLEQGLWDRKISRPHVSIVCNFTKPTPSQPSLLNLDEVRTLFHEFGHALHSLLTNCTYVSLAGTNVYWDFVELPSQIMENWVNEKEGLSLYARHYQTGEALPEAMINRIRDSSKFQAGWMSLRQLTFATLDLAWHSEDPSQVKDIEAFEKQKVGGYQFFDLVPGTSMSASFSHIFAGGYSAGYYSYKWAEVLDADAFEYFLEKGIFSSEVAEKFRAHVLSRGGTEHPMELYKKFRGREPDPKALLRRDGLL